MAERTEPTVQSNRKKEPQGREQVLQLVKSEKHEAQRYGEGTPMSERLNRFIQRNRKPIAFGSLGILVLLIGFIATVSIRDALHTKALGQLEDFNQRYDVLRIDLEEPSKAADVQALVDELSHFAPRHTGYAGARGYSILGSLYADKKAWEDAEKAWTNAAKVGTKTYLAPVSLCNAAFAAEEGGNIPGAIELYRQSIAFKDIFPGAARAQFSIGRLEEAQNHQEAALEAYQGLLNTWPNDAVWTSLAQSRIIFLKSR
ncbi:MAG: tetratricopeptide repeat protein [Treponema sp.]|jgi:tetratricopeptide (TPR) repeat protein|nr:tetratricopeptide repeat protein [Treponema sp.]